MTTAPARVDIREVGPRDGLQLAPPLAFDAKERLIRALAASGLTRIEATAFVSPRAVPSMADAERVAELVAQLPGITWSALVASANGAQRALASRMTQLEYVVSASDGHSVANMRRTTSEATAAIGDIVRIAHDAGASIEVIIATAWDCPFDGPTPAARTVEVARQAAAAGADALCLGDTVGTTVPGRVVRLVDQVREVAPQLPLGAHFHNTRGAGIACAWAAVTAGVTQLDASIAGFGGCPFAPGASGNIATEELVYLLNGSGVDTGVDLDLLLSAARLADSVVGQDARSQLLRAGGPLRPLDAPKAAAAG